jgi:hypothetical protein
MGSGQSVSALKKAKKTPTDAEATRIWSDMDADNGGTLTVKEIIDALKKNYPDYTASKIKAAVDHFDKDGDGKISRDEVRCLSLRPMRPILLLPVVATHAGTACPVSAVHRSVVCSGDQHRAHQARAEGAEAPVDDQVPSARSSGGGGGGGGAARRRQQRGVDGGTCRHAACSVYAVHVHAVHMQGRSYALLQCMQCTCMCLKTTHTPERMHLAHAPEEARRGAHTTVHVRGTHMLAGRRRTSGRQKRL